MRVTISAEAGLFVIHRVGRSRVLIGPPTPSKLAVIVDSSTNPLADQVRQLSSIDLEQELAESRRLAERQEAERRRREAEAARIAAEDAERRSREEAARRADAERVAAEHARRRIVELDRLASQTLSRFAKGLFCSVSCLLYPSVTCGIRQLVRNGSCRCGSGQYASFYAVVAKPISVRLSSKLVLLGPVLELVLTAVVPPGAPHSSGTDPCLFAIRSEAMAVPMAAGCLAGTTGQRQSRPLCSP